MGVKRDYVIVLSCLFVVALLSGCNKGASSEGANSLSTENGDTAAAASNGLTPAAPQTDIAGVGLNTGLSVEPEGNVEQPTLAVAQTDQEEGVGLNTGLSVEPESDVEQPPLAAAQTDQEEGVGLNTGLSVEPEDNVEQPLLGASAAVNGLAPAVEFCDASVLHTDSVEIPFLEKPEFMSPYTDPALGARVTRITNSELGEVNKPVYSTMQAWNADESYLLLYRTGVSDAGHILLDGYSYEYIKHLDLSASGIEELFWSHTDPEIIYYISRRASDFGQLKEFNVNLGVGTVLADFREICGGGLPNAGNDVQMHAVTDDLFGFRCEQDDGHDIMFSYQPSTGSLISAPIGMGSEWSDWSSPVPSPSGNRFFHQGYVLDADLRTIEHQLDMANPLDHSSIGSTYDGKDAFYQVAFNPSPNGCDGDLYSGVGHLVEHNLETGECRNIISEENGYPYTTSSTHISAQAYRLPERIALSSIGSESQLSHFTNGIAAPALFSEIYLAQTIPDDTKVCRLAHHRSYGKSARNGGYTPYFGEPHATISPSGTRIIFGSDWYDSGSVDSFVIELPDYIGY